MSYHCRHHITKNTCFESRVPLSHSQGDIRLCVPSFLSQDELADSSSHPLELTVTRLFMRRLHADSIIASGNKQTECRDVSQQHKRLISIQRVDGEVGEKGMKDSLTISFNMHITIE